MDARSYAASETLKDGTIVTVRAIRPGDAGAILQAFRGMDRESVYRRFFSPKKELSPAELDQLTDVDFSQVVALVITKATESGEVLIGGGRYATDDSSSGAAEIAFMTGGNYRGLGIASLILKHLVLIAREAGVSRFDGEVLAENQPMLAVFRRSGLPMKLRRDGGTVHVTLSLDSRKEQPYGT
ncbi:N-acetyltransferase family protein [Methyloceanibacter sp.]|uniref:GNAT family N-acetyltransferase n=1 Tax=Methyloceanibacter sp. TaxID=1965321 RepID=UPI003D6D882C